MMSGDLDWSSDTSLADVPLIVDSGVPNEIDACFFSELVVLGVAETFADQAPRR